MSGKRRRQFARNRYLDSLTQSIPAAPVSLEIAIESALKGGYCPACGNRVGRTVRDHYLTCGGAR